MLSRVADSLYWMSRYLERAEHVARLLDVNLQGMLDQGSEPGPERWERLLGSLGVKVNGTALEAYAVTKRLAFDPKSVNSISACVSAARENARQVRQQIASEMWEQINTLYLKVRGTTMDDLWNREPHDFLTEVKEGIHTFQGVTDSTLSHGEGWRFIQTGRFLERASATAMLLEDCYGRWSEAVPAGGEDGDGEDDDGPDYMGWVSLLKSCTAFEAYCKVYTADVRPERILEFLLLDNEFPRSVAYCAHKVQVALDMIADKTDSRRNSRTNRLAGKLCADLDFGALDEIGGGRVSQVLSNVQKGCSQIHQAVHEQYIAYPIESALSA